MKIIHLAMIILMVIGVLVVPSAQNAEAIPSFSPRELYNLSDTIFYGQVLTKGPGPGPDYYYYQIKVMTYFKNQQTPDTITVAGHKPGDPRAPYPQFEIGDNAIFYIKKTDGVNTIYWNSQKAGNSCSVQSFLESSPISTTPKIGPTPSSHIYIEDVNGIMPYIPLTNHTAVFHDDDVWNDYPESRTVPITLSIRDEYDGQQVFNQTQTLEMQACSGPEKVQWNFVPTQITNYVATVTDDKSKISMSFNSIYNSTVDSQIILPPLKQFKSGISALDVTCKTGLQLVIKSEDLSPACVTPDTSSMLVKRGWTHDNIILPKNMPHIVIPPLNDTTSGKPEATNENKNSSLLQLFLSVDSEYENPGGPISIDVGLNNTASVPLTLAKSDNWPRDDLRSGLCSNLPFGISIMKGYYAEQNMSSAKSLVIYQTVPCPLPPQIKSYTFQPLSTNTTQECDTLFSCTDLVNMKAHLEINGFIDNNGQHHPFRVGTYTIIAGDEWGHVSILHFTEEYATAYSNQIGK